MINSFRSSIKGQKERRDDPGRFDPIGSDTSSSAPTKKFRGFIPKIQHKINRNSSHSVRSSHIQDKSHKGAPSGDAVKRNSEPEDAGVGERSWLSDDTHCTHNEPTKYIASGQSASNNVHHVGERSPSPYWVSSLDPGRTDPTSIGSHEEPSSADGDNFHRTEVSEYRNRFEEKDSALQWSTEVSHLTSAPIPQQRAAELPADETSSSTQKHEPSVGNLPREELEAEAATSRLPNCQIERKSLRTSADPKYRLGELSSTNLGLISTTRPIPTGNSTIHRTHTEPSNLVTESSYDYVQSQEYENKDQYARNWTPLSSKQHDEHELVRPHSSQHNIASQRRYSEPKETAHVGRSFTDQTNHYVEEGPNQRQRDHANVAAGIGNYVTDHEDSRIQDATYSTKHAKTNTIDTTGELGRLETRIRNTLKKYNVPMRPGLDPFSNLSVWFFEELGAKERIIQAQNIDPKKRDIKVLKKEVGKLTKEKQSLEPYKLRHDDLKKEVDNAQEKINGLTQEVAQVKKEKKKADKNLVQMQEEFQQRLDAVCQERNDYMHKLRATEVKLETVDKARSSAQAGLLKYRTQRDEYIQENGQLRRSVEHLQQQNKQITREAEEELLNAASRYELEMSQLEEKHSQEISKFERQKDQEVSELKHRSDLKAREMQAIIDGKDRVIAAQDMRMASYSKPTHGLISDGDFAHRFSDLSMKLDTLVDTMPRPQQYVSDNTLDPSNFLGRNAARGTRIWSKFARRVCWDIIMRGFFQRQPGFGAFGSQGDGYATLLHLHQLFTPSRTQDTVTQANFPNNKKTNDWRASLFEAILKDVTSSSTDLTVNGFPAFFRANVRTVAENLTTTLQKICQTVLDPQCLRLILELCNEFGVLSLQMGSQQSLVVLETCEHEEYVQSGVFKDDNNYSENDLQVDIMVQPSLKRIGDGGQDLTKEKVLVVGDIVSLKAGY
ncbi:hypothetical protein HD806DRAFT_507130 [Xylariaceae sp. AK1471]|nr:hypothetical protein HD806DRAFT_507130 [Xylariaceae sp. AK1471]